MKHADLTRAEDIVEQALAALDDRHFSEDFKARRIVAALAEAGFIKDPQ